MSVCAHVHMRVRLDVVLYMCMYVYVCGFTFVGFVCLSVCTQN